MELNQSQLAEIADALDSGLLCFVHRETKAVEAFQDPSDAYFEEEFWQETIDKVEANLDEYVQFKAMSSHDNFLIMENFTNTLPDKNLQNKLYKVLSEHKPFSKFKFLIDNSAYRADWFKFRDQAQIDWVKSQLEK